MPELIQPHSNLCFYCGEKANYISFNSKKYRCSEKQSGCKGIIKRQEEGRQLNISYEDRIKHMKLMSENGHSKLKKLHKNKKWKKKKGEKFQNL